MNINSTSKIVCIMKAFSVWKASFLLLMVKIGPCLYTLMHPHWINALTVKSKSRSEARVETDWTRGDKLFQSGDRYGVRRLFSYPVRLLGVKFFCNNLKGKFT